MVYNATNGLEGTLGMIAPILDKSTVAQNLLVLTRELVGIPELNHPRFDSFIRGSPLTGSFPIPEPWVIPTYRTCRRSMFLPVLSRELEGQPAKKKKHTQNEQKTLANNCEA